MDKILNRTSKSEVHDLTDSGIIQILDETNISNKYDRLKTFYQLTKGGHVGQKQFCFILEDYFNLTI